MTVLYYVYWLYCIIATAVVILASLYYVHHLQMLSYNASAYADWIKGRFMKDWFPMMLTGVVGIMLKIANIFFIQKFPIMAYICFYGADLIYLYLLFSLYLAYRKEKESLPPFQRDGAAIRVLVLAAILAFLCVANLMRETRYQGSVSWGQYMLPYVVGYLPGMLAPLLVGIALCVTSPRRAFAKGTETSFYEAEDEAENGAGDEAQCAETAAVAEETVHNAEAPEAKAGGEE